MTKLLSKKEEDQFIDEGYLIIEGAFNPKTDTPINTWCKDVWQRCKADPNKPEDWPDKIHLPVSEKIPFKSISEDVHNKVCEIIGGEERLNGELHWHNGFIANFAFGRDKPWIEPKDAGGWHADGDFFKHFLDSPEQGILIGSYFTDVEHQGGATLVSPGSHHIIARFLAQHPEGVLPDFVGSCDLKNQCDTFIEATVKAGDIVVMHPFMLHASSQNLNNKVRLMNNNNIALKSPMSFNRTEDDYSLVEKGILKALGKDKYDFKITQPRERIVPKRVAIQKAMLEEEKARKLKQESASK